MYNFNNKLGDSLWDYYPWGNGWIKRIYPLETNPNRTWYFTYDLNTKNHPKYGNKTIRTDGEIICHFTPSEVIENVYYVCCTIKDATYVEFETSNKRFQYHLPGAIVPRKPGKKKPRRGAA